MTRKLYIYTLKLEDNKYYVGRSYNVPRRLNEHYDGKGSEWTKKYNPIKLYEVFEDCTKFDEDKYTVMYMSIFGIENVRGGSFCSIELSGADKYILKKMICNATDKCVKCEEYGHYFTQCPKFINKLDEYDKLEKKRNKKRRLMVETFQDNDLSLHSDKSDSMSSATDITEINE